MQTSIFYKNEVNEHKIIHKFWNFFLINIKIIENLSFNNVLLKNNVFSKLLGT